MYRLITKNIISVTKNFLATALFVSVIISANTAVVHADAAADCLTNNNGNPAAAQACLDALNGGSGGGGASSTAYNSACDGLELTGVSCGDSDTAKTSFGTIIKNIINILSIVVGAVAVIMIIIGGFRYVISGGDSNGITGAKNTIMYAIVGLVIVLFAQIIVRFVLTNSVKPATTGSSAAPATPGAAAPAPATPGAPSGP